MNQSADYNVFFALKVLSRGSGGRLDPCPTKENQQMLAANLAVRSCHENSKLIVGVCQCMLLFLYSACRVFKKLDLQWATAGHPAQLHLALWSSKRQAASELSGSLWCTVFVTWKSAGTRTKASNNSEVKLRAASATSRHQKPMEILKISQNTLAVPQYFQIFFKTSQNLRNNKP